MTEEKKDNKLLVIKKTISELETQAENLSVNNTDDYDGAASLLEQVIKKKKDVLAYWEPQEKKAFDVKKKASEALRGLRDMIDESIAPLDRAETLLRNARKAYKNLCDEIDRKEKIKLEERAAKEAEKEKNKLLERAEKTTDVVAEETLLEDADEVVAKPVFQKPTIKKTVKTKTGTRNTWVEEIEIEITDGLKVCALIGNGQLPINCVTISVPKIRAYVKSFGKKDGSYEGYKVKRVSNERVTLDGRN